MERGGESHIYWFFFCKNNLFRTTKGEDTRRLFIDKYARNVIIWYGQFQKRNIYIHNKIIGLK